MDDFVQNKRYETELGTAYQGNSLDLLSGINDKSIQAIITSPPFALKRKKAYGNPAEHEYVEWFFQFVDEFQRVLTDDGSLVIEVGGAWLPGSPTRSVYQFEVLIELVRKGGFYLAEEFFWFNRAKMPGPAQWVNIERIRVKDAISPIWWLSKSERPKANNKNILTTYSKAQEKLFIRGYNEGPRPSGWIVGSKFDVDNGGAIPSNVIEASNTRSMEPYQRYCREYNLTIHPARFPREIPELFIKFLTDEGDIILDPFGGSNMTGAVAESLGRQWITFELQDEYLAGSVGRFDKVKIAGEFNK